MPVFAEIQLSTLVFLAALMVTIGLLLARSHRYFARQPSEPSPVFPAQPREPAPGRHLGAPEELARWEVQMHDTARDLSAQLDSKMGALEHLIREADRAAARLEATLAATEQPRPTSQAEALRSAGRTDRPIAADLTTNQQDGERPLPERRYQEIYTLSDYGYSAAEIAQRVGSPVGEVELILSLREKR